MIDTSKPVMIEGRPDHVVTIVDENYDGKIATIVTCKSGKSFWVFSKSGESEPPGSTMQLINAPETRTTFVVLYAPGSRHLKGYCTNPFGSLDEINEKVFGAYYGVRGGVMRLTWEGEKLVDYELIKEGEQK
jgi:hypothetical protein